MIRFFFLCFLVMSQVLQAFQEVILDLVSFTGTDGVAFTAAVVMCSMRPMIRRLMSRHICIPIERSDMNWVLFFKRILTSGRGSYAG